MRSQFGLLILSISSSLLLQRQRLQAAQIKDDRLEILKRHVRRLGRFLSEADAPHDSSGS